ncbi:PH domain-containing protein [Dokdonella sp.]|uniref:PH domain-containing protein n=1 Tax=Dokdonella sp. TaxID=2291710 RepID=UPI0026112F52|nr:PH domain-containing protein [Dokdonella sp.]
MKTFPVRYGTLVKAVTALVVAAMLGIAAMGLRQPQADVFSSLATVVFPLALVLVAALYTVLRYELDAAGLHVVRPLGRRCVARSVSSLRADAEALKGALRVFGNGGLFSITGWYGTRKYGRCRVWATEREDLVVLDGDRGTVILSPRDRAEFIAVVAARFGVRA